MLRTCLFFLILVLPGASLFSQRLHNLIIPKVCYLVSTATEGTNSHLVAWQPCRRAAAGTRISFVGFSSSHAYEATACVADRAILAGWQCLSAPRNPISRGHEQQCHGKTSD